MLHLAPPRAAGAADVRTANLLRALRRSPRRARIVYARRAACTAIAPARASTRRAPLRPATDRARRRADAEERLRRFGRASGVPVSLLRVPGIYALDRPGGDPRERVARGTPVLAAADDVYTGHIHADDLARACVAALARQAAARVNVIDETELRMGDYFDLVGRPLRPGARRGASPAPKRGHRLSPLQMSFLRESRRLVNRAPEEASSVSCCATRPSSKAWRPPGTTEHDTMGRGNHRADDDDPHAPERSRNDCAATRSLRVPMKVVVATRPMPAAPFIDAIGSRAPDIALLEYGSSLSDAELADVDVMLGWQMPRGLPARLPRLRWVCSTAAGVEKLLAPDLAPHVRVSRIVDPEQAAGIAQFVVAMALRHARGLERYQMQQRERAWLRQPTPIARHRVAVLGTGAIGTEVAACLERCGLVVRGWNRRSSETLHALLAASEIVVCALPLTAATESILDASAFAALPRGAYVINVARGANLDEAALIEAVRSGHLSGAALDVQRREPLPADDPLWTVPGITITPHIAAQPSTETIAAQFVAAARALSNGDRLPNEIDRARGY